jgi:hypothetical protein
LSVATPRGNSAARGLTPTRCDVGHTSNTCAMSGLAGRMVHVTNRREYGPIQRWLRVQRRRRTAEETAARVTGRTTGLTRHPRGSRVAFEYATTPKAQRVPRISGASLFYRLPWPLPDPEPQASPDAAAPRHASDLPEVVVPPGRLAVDALQAAPHGPTAAGAHTSLAA